MDVLVLIDKLDDTVHNSKPVPLTDQVRVDKEEIYDILDQMRATIPEEIKQARWIVKERQEMLAEAKREAERIVKEAREEQIRLIGDEEVVKQAERQADEIVEDARAREREIRLGAEDYADDILNTLEINLEKFTAAVQRGRDRLQGRFFAALQSVAPALNGGRELLEVDLEGVEDVVGVVLRSQADLAPTGARVLDDLVGLALGLFDDLLVADQANLLLARLLDDALGLALGLGQHLLALLDDPTRLLDLLGDRGAHLVEDVVDLLLVDAHLVGERHRLGVVDGVVQLVDQYKNVHLVTSAGHHHDSASQFLERFSASCKRPATASGTSPDRSPPNMASSLTPLEERKLYWGADIRYMLSMSGASLRLSWFISNSYSKSEIARSPFTIARAPLSRAKSTRRVSKDFTCTLPSFSVSAWTNATRSSAVNTVCFLRTGWLTTPTTTLSNTEAARPMMSRWPRVTGS